VSVSEWREVTLGDVCDSVSNTHPFEKAKLIFLNTSDVYDGSILHNNYSPVAEMPGQAKKSIKKGDILYSEIRPKNKRYAMVNFDASDYVVSTKFMVIRSNGLIVNKFLYLYLTSNEVLETLQQVAEARSGTFPQITFSQVAELKLNLPPIPEQKAIVATLSALDDMIELNNKINKTLEEMAQAIFKSWFVDFEPFKDGEFEESELGLIPKGWRVGKLDDVLSEIETGNRPKGGVAGVESGIPSIGAENVLGLGKYDYSKEKYVSEEFYNSMKKGKLKDWDVLLYKDGAQLGRKTMFALGFPHKKCCVNSHVFILRSNSRMNQCYLYFWLDQDYMTQKIIGLNANSAQPGINQPAVKGLPILIPPIDVLERFDDLVVPIIKNLFSNCLENNILVSIRDTLLPKLMSGEIRVPVDEVM